MMELYRYRPYNENTLRELLEGELWHSHVRHLNDPFEHPFNFDWDGICVKNLPAINAHLNLIPPEDFMFNYANLKYRDHLLNTFKEWFIMQMRDLQKHAESTFICCFSKHKAEPLMWSHYANGMTGLCLIYDENILANHSRLKIKGATYNKVVEKLTFRDLSLVNMVRNVNAQYNFELGRYMSSVSAGCELSKLDFAYQKHVRWKYEQEVRSVLYAENEEENAKAGVIENAGENAIKGVIIGSKMNKINRKIITTLCKERSLPIHIATPNKYNYSVDIHFNVADPINFN